MFHCNYLDANFNFNFNNNFYLKTEEKIWIIFSMRKLIEFLFYYFVLEILCSWNRTKLLKRREEKWKEGN